MAHTDGIDSLVPRLPPDQDTRDRLRSSLQSRIAQQQARGFGPAKFGASDKTTRDVANFIKSKTKELSKPSIKAAAKAGKVLRISTPSTCFAAVTWESTSDDGDDGIVTGEFYRGGAVVYDGPMSLDEFIEWSSSDSVGKFYNSDVDAF
jgi:hypothetical protein